MDRLLLLNDQMLPRLDLMTVVIITTIIFTTTLENEMQTNYDLNYDFFFGYNLNYDFKNKRKIKCQFVNEKRKEKKWLVLNGK